MSETHEHRFKMTAHMDGCHWFSTTGVCDCGAVIHQMAERDLEEDGMSAIWMDLEGCERCQELFKGAKPTQSQEVTEAGAR